MNFVDALNVLKNLDGVSEILCRADGVHDVNTGVAVGEAVVVVGVDNKVVRMAYIHQFLFVFVLEVNDKVAFNRGVASHVGKFPALFEVGKGDGGVSKETAPVGIARGFHQVLEAAGKRIVNAQGNDFAHGVANRFDIIIMFILLIISCDYILNA